jgi:hypothetical protein
MGFCEMSQNIFGFVIKGQQSPRFYKIYSFPNTGQPSSEIDYIFLDFV